MFAADISSPLSPLMETTRSLTYSLCLNVGSAAAFTMKAAADPTFKQREYVKDLVGFINGLKGEEMSAANIKFTKANQ